jgi:hypothetical protein
MSHAFYRFGLETYGCLRCFRRVPCTAIGTAMWRVNESCVYSSLCDLSRVGFIEHRIEDRLFWQAWWLRLLAALLHQAKFYAPRRVIERDHLLFQQFILHQVAHGAIIR